LTELFIGISIITLTILGTSLPGPILSRQPIDPNHDYNLCLRLIRLEYRVVFVDDHMGRRMKLG
ncbi:MAG: hypothetical protein QXU90_04000, partial [Acidilobaceae archaeon]